MAGEKSVKRAVAMLPAPAVDKTANETTDSGNQARAAMEKSMEQVTRTAEGFFKAAEEAAEFGRGNFEAVSRSAQLFAAGFQDIGRQVFALSQVMTDQAMESAKALAAVKSLKEAADIQAAFAKASMERSMSEAAKLQEAAFKLAETVSAPIAARMSLAVEKFGKPLAV